MLNEKILANNILRLIKKREFTLLISLIILVIIIGIRFPRFLEIDNFFDIMDDTSILLIVAIGQFIVILTGGIDLSVASGIALSGMSVGLINQYFPEIPIIIIIFISLIIGFLLGSFNGILVSIGRIPPIITTLGTMSIYRGFVFVLSNGKWVSAHEMTEGFRNLPQGEIFGLSGLLITAIITFVIFAVFLNFIKTGREIYAVGDNELATKYVGIKINKIKYLVFMLTGVIVGLSGFLWVARYASAQNETALGFELQTIAACVIGGVSISGGLGSIWGVLLGSVLMGLASQAGADTLVIVLVGLLTGLSAGFLNGIIITGIGIPAIAVTIGSMSLFRGIAFVILGDKAFTKYPESFAYFGQGYIGNTNIPFQLVFFIIFAVIFGIVLHKTTYGRKLYAIGNNPTAARFSGINVSRIKLINFTFIGLCCGIASVFLTSRIGSTRPNIANGWELEIITTVVLGGVSIMGGLGNLHGVIISIFLLGLMKFGMGLINIPGKVMNMVTGFLLILAIMLPGFIRQLQSNARLKKQRAG